MIIRITIKQLGKKRNKIQEQDFYLSNCPSTVGELITEAVRTCVAGYNQRFETKEADRAFSAEEIEDMSEIGKIAFGLNYGNRRADFDQAAETALQAYEDGLIRIFVDGEELGAADQSLSLCEGASCTFLKLTMLSGSFFYTW